MNAPCLHPTTKQIDPTGGDPMGNEPVPTVTVCADCGRELTGSNVDLSNERRRP